MSNVSDIQDSVASATISFRRFDCIDVAQIDSLDGLIALSQIYQYRGECAAISGNCEIIDETALCGIRISAVADHICRLYNTLRDVSSCVRALAQLRAIEYGYDLDRLEPFVDRHAALLRRPVSLTDADRLMLAIIQGDDNAAIGRLAEICMRRRPDAALASALLTAAAILPDSIRLDAVIEWFDREVSRLMRLQRPVVETDDLQAVGLAPMIWSILPAMRPSVEALATLTPHPGLMVADMSIARLKAFLVYDSLLAAISAA